MLQGLRQLKKLGIEKARVFGDFQSIIQILIKNFSPKDLKLNRIIARIKMVIGKFQELGFFHVPRANSREADKEANRAVHLSSGTLQSDEDESWDMIS